MENELALRVGGWIGALLIAAQWPATSAAQEYPARPIRMVVTLAAGGPVDAVARMLAASMSEQLGQQVVVDNRPGAGGSVGGEAVARANPDGHIRPVAETPNMHDA